MPKDKGFSVFQEAALLCVLPECLYCSERPVLHKVLVIRPLMHRHPQQQKNGHYCRPNNNLAAVFAPVLARNGILRLTDEAWISDNTDPYDRLIQQYGFSFAYAPQVMVAWVTDSPHWENKRTTSLAYRMLSSMEGALGIGTNINKWGPEDMATAKRLIAAYKQVRPTIAQGGLYRLIAPTDGSAFSATENVKDDKSQAVVFAFIHSTTEGHPYPVLKLKGLDPTADYALTAIEGKAAKATPAVASGAWWMNHGLDLGPDFRGDFQAAAFRLDKK